MSKTLLNHIDTLLEKYKKDHKGQTPLYIVLSPDEVKAVRTEIKRLSGDGDDQIVTTYKDIKLAEHPSLLDGNIYVSNELPETGS